jgi:hypothetical protein
MDRDSYDSSDWFNAIDWTLQDNNWGHGLPLQDHNGNMWDTIQPLLANPDLAPTPEHINLSRDLFGSLLQIRMSSPLFHLATAQQVIKLVRFHNTGPDQVPGLIAMSISDDPDINLDTNQELIFVLFNADPRTISFKLVQWEISDLHRHPIQDQDPIASLANFDPETQSFIIPGNTTVIFTGNSHLQPVDTEQPATQAEITTKTQETNVSTTDTPEKTEAQPLKPAQTPTAGMNYKNLVGWVVGGIALLLGISGFAIFQKRYRKSPEE